MKTGPYAGVTGFMDLKEVVICSNAFCEAAKKLGPQVERDLKMMVGILVSPKTLAGGTNKWPNRYPQIDDISRIAALRQDNLLYTIHYNTDNPATIADQIENVLSIAPDLIDAIQLNIRWVSPVQLQRVKRSHPDLRIILQVGAGALEDVKEPGEIFLGEALQAYARSIDDFLVDPSGGKGEPLDVWHAFACIADDEIPAGIQPNIAGGFAADNVHKARGLMRRLKRPVGLDAEGRLRTPMHMGDAMDLNEATRYLGEAVALIGDAIIRYPR
jgi:phosphoribosylanthranilate isomerase